MGKQMSIGKCAPKEFRSNPKIVALYAAKRRWERQIILAQRQGDAWSVMEGTDRVINLDAQIYELQNPQS